MAEYESLDITFSEIPIRKLFTIGDDEYDFEFLYNSVEDSISCTVRDLDGNILFSSPVVYGQSLNDSIVDGFNPDILIIPFDLDEEYRLSFENIHVGKENFGSTVKLFIINDGTVNV